MGVLQNIFGDNEVANMARVFLNSAGAGIPQAAERAFGNPANADRTDQIIAESRKNVGFGGDLANVAGYIAPGVGALKALKSVRLIPAAVRAAPEAIPALARAARVGLVNAGGPGLTRAEAAARLGIDYVPSLAEKALNATGRAVVGTAALPFRHPIISALTGLGALAEYAGRSGDNTAKATPARAVAAAPGDNGLGYDPLPVGMKEAAQLASKQQTAQATNPQFSQLASMAAKANGGKVSIDQLAALADIAYKTAPRLAPEKPPTPAEIATQRGLQLGEQYWGNKIQNAKSQEEADAAYQQMIQLYGQFGKARTYDVTGGAAYSGLPDDY